jgi:hypothetical protein
MSHSKKIEKIASYVDVYDGQIRKEAVTGVEIALGAMAVYGIMSLVSSAATGIRNQTGDIQQVRNTLGELVQIINEQEKEEQGFGNFGNVFRDFRKNCLTVMSLADEMIKPPSGPQDTSQIQNAQRFIDAGNGILIGSSSVLAALEQMKGFWAGVGDFLHGANLNFGMYLNRWQEFSGKMNQIQGALSLLISQTEQVLKKALADGRAADAQASTQGAAGAEATTGLGGLSQVTI